MSARTLGGARESAARGLAGGVTLIVALAMSAALVQAQTDATVPRIGFLMGNFPAALTDRLEAFQHGLRELGYVEGKNIVVEYRSAEEKIERLPALASELARLRVVVIVTAGPTVTRAAKEATSTVPIVMAFDSDPVGSGSVASLARPGGNITGLSALYPEISGKQLALLKEITPGSRA
jgi:putative ABC transport system substrate-binding protein